MQRTTAMAQKRNIVWRHPATRKLIERTTNQPANQPTNAPRGLGALHRLGSTADLAQQVVQGEQHSGHVLRLVQVDGAEHGVLRNAERAAAVEKLRDVLHAVEGHLSLLVDALHRLRLQLVEQPAQDHAALQPLGEVGADGGAGPVFDPLTQHVLHVDVILLGLSSLHFGTEAEGAFV